MKHLFHKGQDRGVMKGYKAIACTLGGGSLLIMLGIVIKVAGYFIMKMELYKERQLLNGSDSLERWITLPMPLEYKVYLFNVSNPKEVSSGAEPIVTELGPYVYDEFIQKEYLNYTEDTISYYVRRTYFFNKHKSGNNTEDDLVTTVNVALLGSSYAVENKGQLAIRYLENAFKHLFPWQPSIFWTVKIKDLLFDGVLLKCTTEISLFCSQFEALVPQTIRKLDSGDFSFSFFHYKNNTLVGPFVENRGIYDISKLGQILSFKGSSTLEAWQPNSTCSVLRGTDSTIYPPFFSRDDIIYIFEPDVCGSLAAVYEKDVQEEGLQTFRFVNSPENFGDPSEYEASRCRCKDPNACPKPGVIDLTKCQGAPVIMSMPHFYLADLSYTNYVKGFTPNKEDHETFIDIEPVTGVPLEGHKRLQLNMYLRHIKRMELFKNVKEGLFPLIWIEEGVKLKGGMLGKLHSFHSTVKKVKCYSTLIILLGCVITSLLPLYCIFENKINNLFSNTVTFMQNRITSDQKTEEDKNKKAVNSSSTPAHNELSLKCLSNSSMFPGDLQTVPKTQNINEIHPNSVP